MAGYHGSIMTAPLDDADLGTLMTLLKNAASKWQRIGDALGFPPGQLNTIAAKPTLIIQGAEGYLRELLQHWLKWAPPKHQMPTLGTLVQALQAAEEDRMAYDLPRQFQQEKGGLQQYGYCMASEALGQPTAGYQHGMPQNAPAYCGGGGGGVPTGGSGITAGNQQQQHVTAPTQQVVSLTAANAVKICDVLKKSEFRSSSWQELAARLGITDPGSIKKSSDTLCLQETIRQWLQNDIQASWEKLAEEASMVETYGPATKQNILRNAGVSIQ